MILFLTIEMPLIINISLYNLCKKAAYKYNLNNRNRKMAKKRKNTILINMNTHYEENNYVMS